ncbi:MAG TPA: formate dehydrogenase accessory protein FdhE [Candidatus Acidoferrum sp.]|nr:formate dehydrogenase accessory protein FdhE [Candidatus Acidoferrum sp.]
MNSHAVAISEYDRRIQRAEWLIAQKSAATELLAFYREIAGFQKSLLQQIAAKVNVKELERFQEIREAFELAFLLPKYGSFLSLVAGKAPAALAEAAQALAKSPSEQRRQILADYCQNGGTSQPKNGAFEQFFARAFIEPYASLLAANRISPPVDGAPRTCPACGSQPVFGVLRAEGDGAKRLLTCSFCGSEWEFRRILCPACGEEDEKNLPVYQAEEFPQIRIEACDTCKYCLRTIDLTKDGRAVPVVDDIAAIPLTLWANEHGYQRLQENLLGS